MAEKYFELCDMLSYCADDYTFTMVARDSNNEDIIIKIPLHDDFLDAIMCYRHNYKKHILNTLTHDD